MQPFETVSHVDGTGGSGEKITPHFRKSLQIGDHGFEQVAKQRNESIRRPSLLQKRDSLTPDGQADMRRDYTLNRKWKISPSWTRYSFPSRRILPCSLAAASEPQAMKS